MKKIFLTLALITGMIASAQVRIGGTGTAVDANAILELQSTTKGLLFPKVALTSTTAFAPLSAHTAGMTVYNTATAGDVTPGLYVNSGTAWVSLGGSASSSAALNVTAEQTASYTALATDDIILVNYNTGGLKITLPSTGVPVGKKYYISNIGSADCGFTNTIRATTTNTIPGQMSGIVMYLGTTASGDWTIVSNQ